MKSPNRLIRTIRIPAQVHRSGFFRQSGNLRIEIGQRAIELIPVAGILACLQIFLDSRAGEQQNLPFAARFQLFSGQLLFRVFSFLLLMFLDLFLDGLTFPSSGHACIL